MLRRPDGRVQPLLFDGQPVLPSGVYLDEDSRLHVGRDAARVAQLDPSRFEPNPKQRIDERTVLLGGFEVPTVDLLAAILHQVGVSAVEAVGFVPRAVVTYPASWGSVRRDVLLRAAHQAGWPPIWLVPEPVAAARYFAGTMRRPIPVGSTLAVFDFGGGTLDIAVVKNDGAKTTGIGQQPGDGQEWRRGSEPPGQHSGQFTVVGSGGLEDLGGLDLDAALVSHLGRIIAHADPRVWAALSNPQTAQDRRARRLFWEDVRGAKEMLSRAASAPVPVPGLEQALHLTRAELETIATPLLRRAVAETKAVIERCGLTPEQLGGLFLVGGSSRVPLVARALHAELGIAPAVLEQPELPVAEGALAELPPETTQVMPGAARPAEREVGAPAPVQNQRRKLPWLLAAGLALVLAVTAGLYFLLRDPYSEVDFVANLAQEKTVPLLGDGTYGRVAIAADVAYLATERDEKAGSRTVKKIQVIAYDLVGGKEKWRSDDVLPTLEGDWDGFHALPSALFFFRKDGDQATVYALDPDDKGKQLWTASYPSGDRWVYYEDYFLWADSATGTLSRVSYRTGTPDAKVDGWKGAKLLAATTKDDPGWWDSRRKDTRVVLVNGSTKNARVLDVAEMKLGKEYANVGGADDHYVVRDGRLYVGSDDPGYQVTSFDLKDMKATSLYRADSSARKIGKDSHGDPNFHVCGDRVCLIDIADDRNAKAEDKAKSSRLVSIGPDGKTWAKPFANAEALKPVGDRVAVRVDLDPKSPWFELFDAEGDRVGQRQADRVPQGLTSGSLLLFGDHSNYVAGGQTSLAGYSARSGERFELGVIAAKLEGCAWTEKYLACPREKDFGIWQFAN